MIIFNCSSCQQSLRIGDEHAGETCRCPLCGAWSDVPGTPKRTTKSSIIFKLSIFPFLVLSFWGFLFGTVDVERGVRFVVSGMVAVFIIIGILWAVTNIGTFLFNPTYYWLWKKGGGDPWFDTLDPPFNNDPDSVRYQELYREKLRQENEELIRPIITTPPSSQYQGGIDDPNVI
jgi:hypothetical protein